MRLCPHGLVVAFFSPWLVGAPLLWLARGCRALRPTDWLWAPFFGLAGIVCPLQTLAVFADLPLRVTTPWFWAASGAMWGAMLARRTGRTSLNAVPWRIVLLAIAVYAGQGAGVVAKGVERYRGALHSDQYHYVVLAQFLMDEPFSTGWENLGERPWLVLPVALKSDRIGQSVAHGFFATTSGRNALDTFFPTQLLGPGLLVPAMFLLSVQCGLPRRWTTWAALTAALAPGVALIVSNCFLSHGLCIPVLVAFIAAVTRLARGGGWRPLPAAVATFALGFSVYTEFAPLFIGSAAVALAAGAVRRHVPFSRAVVVAIALAVAPTLNPAATVGALTIGKRGASSGPQMKTWCRTSVWVAAVWLHYEKATLTGGRVDHTVAHVYFYASTGAAALGGLVFVARSLRSGRRRFPSVACASLLLPPLALWVARPEYEYVISKLVLTLTPILVLFVACGLHAVAVRLRGVRLAPAVPFAASLLFVLMVVQTGLEQRARLRGGNDVGPAVVWNDPDMRQLCHELGAKESTDVVIALGVEGGVRDPATASGVLCYHCRRHRIRLADPQRIWMTNLADVPAPQLTQVGDPPAGTLLVVRCGAVPWSGTKYAVVFENRSYQLVRVIEQGTSWVANRRSD